MPIPYKIFPDQATADDIGTRLPPGVLIQTGLGPQDILIVPKLGIDAILAHVSLSQSDQDTLNGLPEIMLPSEEEMNFIAGAPIGSWSFVLEGSSSPTGKFMTQATKMAIPSDLTPAILPANLHLVSMTWINETDGANEDIRLYLDGNLVFTWSLVNKRGGGINSEDTLTPLLELPERGLVSAEIVNTGAPAAKDGILTMYFRMVGEAQAGEWGFSTL